MHGMPDMTSNDQDDSLRKAERDLIAITDQLEIGVFSTSASANRASAKQKQ